MNLRDTLLTGEFSSGITQNYDPINSPDEELLELHIGQEAYNELIVEGREIDHLKDVAVGLENLNKACGLIKEASPIELALVEVATELALSGTDIKSDQILPSLEYYKGKEISIEAIGRFAISIWKAIVKMTKKMWTNVVRFYNSIFRSIPKLRKSAEDMKLRADGVKEKTLTGDKVEMGSATQTLTTNYEAIKSLTDLKEYFDYCSQFTISLLGEYTSLLLKRGEFLKNKLDEQALSDADSIIDIARSLVIEKNPLKEAIHKHPYKLTPSDFAKDERFNANSSYKNPIGLTLLQSKYFVTDLTGEDEINKIMTENGYSSLEGEEKIAAANDVLDFVTKPKTEIVMAYSATKKPKLPKKESAEPISCYDAQTVADFILTICDSVEMNSSSDMQKEIEKTADVIEKVTQKMSSAVDKKELKNGSMATSWRLLAGLNSAWLTMITKPQTQWTNHVFAISRAAIDVCGKSLSLYK